MASNGGSGWLALWSILSIASACALGAGCAAPVEATATTEATETVMFTDRVHMLTLRDPATARAIPGTPAAPVPPPGALLYLGGKVLRNVHVTQVLYGQGSYIPELTATTGVTMESAYTQMVTSGVLDWLSEYNTASPLQVIGRGTFRRSFRISPAASRDGSTISDASIQSELMSQIRANVLPAPDDNE